MDKDLIKVREDVSKMEIDLKKEIAALRTIIEEQEARIKALELSSSKLDLRNMFR